MAETDLARKKRLSMRSWRRGTKEMDLILGPYADTHLSQMNDANLALYDRLLDENDPDLIRWMLGQDAPPGAFTALVTAILAFARTRLSSKV